ncbi:hypothetical protein FACS1894187_10950 [Synergistales bacterium]|nr:hypothetical protein FACS1894187_10950 [Synergistales bacterium]
MANGVELSVRNPYNAKQKTETAIFWLRLCLLFFLRRETYGRMDRLQTDRRRALRDTAASGGLTLSGGGALTVFGGFAGRGGGVPELSADAFTGNTFNKDSDVLVGGAGNFENVIFGYSGDANITSLDVTPGGSANDTVIIDTGSNDVNFNGIIEGGGNIDKKGSGELTLTDITGLSGTITLSEGAIKNGTSDTIDVTVNGTSRQLAPGESTAKNSGGGGGCDAGAGVFALALLSLACAGMKRKEK